MLYFCEKLLEVKNNYVKERLRKYSIYNIYNTYSIHSFFDL